MTFAVSSFFVPKQQSKCLIVLLLVVIQLSWTTVPVTATLGRVLCNVLLDNIPSELQCSNCRFRSVSRYDLEAGIGCDLVDPVCFPVPIGDGYELCAKFAFSGDYYRKRKESRSAVKGSIARLDIPVTDTINVTIPELSLDIEAIHLAPLTIENPFNFASCSVKVGVDQCKCTICYDEVQGIGDKIKLDCTKIKVTSLPDGTDIYFPAIKDGQCFAITDFAP